MLKKRVALLLAVIMAFTSVNGSMLTVAAQEVNESVEETSLQETEVFEELFAEEVQENTENITAEEVTENAEGWETETEEVKENDDVSQETESDTEVSTEEELFDDTEIFIDNSAEVMEVYADVGTSGVENLLDDSYIYCGEFKNVETIINGGKWEEAEKYYYRFVPEEDGKYVFFEEGWSGEALTYMNIFYEKDGSIIEVNSYSYRYTLSADTTYYFYYSQHYSIGDKYKVWIEKVPEIVSVEAGAVREKDFIFELYRNDNDLLKKFLDGFELKITYSDNSVATITFNKSYVKDRYANEWQVMIQEDSWSWASFVPSNMGLGKHDVKITGSGIEEPLLFTVNVITPSERITSVIEDGTQIVQAGSRNGEYIFYKWNPMKGKRYRFSNMDGEDMRTIFFRIDENGTCIEENYDWGEENYFLALNEQYCVGFRAFDGDAASWEVKVETVPMISSIEVLDKSKVSFVKKLEYADLDCTLKIQLDDGTTRKVFFSSSEDDDRIYVDEFNNQVRLYRFKLDEQGQYDLSGDTAWGYDVVGKYVFHFYVSYDNDNEAWNWRNATTPYVDVPYEIVEAESANLEKLENDKNNAVEMTKGYALYSFIPEKSGMYAVTSDLSMDLITVRDANRRNYKLWNNKYSAYAMLTEGETYYITIETSSQYEQARLEIHKVKEITELSVNAEKNEYLADFETFDPAKTQTKVTFEDGSYVTLSGYDSVENAMLYYNVSKENSKKNWSDKLLESGEYTVTPYFWWSWNTTGSGVKVKGWNPTIKTDTIRAVPLDTSRLSSLKAEIWNDITMAGEVGYYTFTAEKEGICILESNLDEYTQGSLYQKVESGWQECGNEIRMKAGEECVIKLGKAENLQVRIHFDEEVRKRIAKAEIISLKEKIYESEDLLDLIAIDVTYEDGTRLTERLKRVYSEYGEIEITAYDVYGNLFRVKYDDEISADGYFIVKYELEYYDYDNLQVAVETVPFDVKYEYINMIPKITEGEILSADLQSGRQYYQFIPKKTGEYVFKLNLLEHTYHYITVDEYNDDYGCLDAVSGYSTSFDDASGYVYEMKAGKTYVVTWEATTDVTEYENATLTLSRMKKTVKDVKISKEPDNKEIFRQQTAAMCLSGLEVEVTYSDGSTEKVLYGKTDSEGRTLVLSDEVRLNGQTKRIYVMFGAYRVSVDLNIVGVAQLQVLTEGQTYMFTMAPDAYKYVRFEPEKTGKYYINYSESSYYDCTCENDGTTVVRTSDGYCSLEKGKTYTFLVHSTNPEGGKVRLGAYLHDTHSWNSGTDTKKATCKETGIRTYQCTVCGEMKTEKISVTNIHDFTKSTWIVTKEATAVAEGTKERICSVCKKAKETQKIAKLKATYQLNVSGTVLLQVGKSVTLKVTGLAKSDSVVSWSSSNTKIATVKNGVVKAAKKAGTATITIKLASGTVIKQNVKVQKGAVKVSAMTVAKTTWNVKQGETIKIVPTSFAPLTATNKTVTYSTSDKKIATVTSKGIVKGIAGGKAKITLKCGNAKVVCTVKVEPVKTTSIKLNKTKAILKKSKTLTLKVTRTPKASTEKITFKSSDKKVATVNANGKITAKKAGIAVITVNCGSTKATCTVTVK